SDQNNSKELDDLKAKADEKNKMIRSLKKRVKIFDEVLTKKQQEHEASIKKEKEAQLLLRKKLRALKNGTEPVTASDEIQLVKKKYKEEVRLMRKKIEDYEARVKKMNGERFEWESEKQKCEEDLKVLLEDYAQKGELLTACQAKVEKYKESERDHHQNFNALKDLYETLEQKYKDTFNKERPEYVGMIRRVESLELENQRLRNSLSQSNNKYESLLLLDTTHQEVIEENEKLTSRIHNIEEWFDEAWAGFRLEVLNFEQKLEKKNDIIRQLKGEREDENKSTLFRQTDSGVFCLQAMKELQGKFEMSKRPDWYVKAVKELIFECSIQQKQKTNENTSNEDVGKNEGSEAEDGQCEKNEEDRYEDDFEEGSLSESSSTTSSVSEEVSVEQQNSSTSHDDSSNDATSGQTSSRPDHADDTETNEDISLSADGVLPKDTKPASNEIQKMTMSQVVTLESDIPKKIDIETKIDDEPSQKISVSVQSELRIQHDDVTTQKQENHAAVNTTNDISANIIIPSDTNVKIVDSLKTLATKKSSNLKRKISPLNGTKKSVSFNQAVDLQYFDEQNTPMTKNKEYVDILKAPNSETTATLGSEKNTQRPAPVRKVYKNIPEYHPIKTTPKQLPKSSNNSLPKLNKISTKTFACESKQEKITAADIFGPSPSKTIQDEENDALFDSNNLDDAMDFLLNM
uniref:Uncharacterized protein n=2 Tax=Clytia hemisphaerica TaxID=252671 RepID=A0A7M5UNR2_9CNID